jgi:hypothetical protein
LVRPAERPAECDEVAEAIHRAIDLLETTTRIATRVCFSPCLQAAVLDAGAID